MQKIRLTEDQIKTLADALDVASSVLRATGQVSRANEMETLLSESGYVERITVRLRDRWVR